MAGVLTRPSRSWALEAYKCRGGRRFPQPANVLVYFHKCGSAPANFNAGLISGSSGRNKRQRRLRASEVYGFFQETTGSQKKWRSSPEKE